jgi:GNAT superfamily N-acetyltransferase
MPEGTMHPDLLPLARVERPMRLPDQVTVNFGPTAAVADFILRTDRAARSAGVRLSLSTDFDELLDLNGRNQEAWYALPPFYDPTFGAIPHGQAFWLRGINADGETVLTHAVRLYLCEGSSFKQEMEALRILYSGGVPYSDARIRAEVTVPGAAEMTGRITVSGALWVRPDYRGNGFARSIPRLTRALSLTTWYPDYHTTFVERPKADGGMVSVYGYRHSAGDIVLHNIPGFPRRLAFVLCWATPEDMTAEVQSAVADRPARINEPAPAIAAE